MEVEPDRGEVTGRMLAALPFLHPWSIPFGLFEPDVSAVTRSARIRRVRVGLPSGRARTRSNRSPNPRPETMQLPGAVVQNRTRLGGGRVSYASNMKSVELSSVTSILALVLSAFSIALTMRQQRVTNDLKSYGLTATMEFAERHEDPDFVIVRNTGPQTFHQVVWWDGVERQHWADEHGETTHGGFVDTLPPGAQRRFHGPFYGPFTEYGLIELDYRDDRGRRWRKAGADSERVRVRHNRYTERYPFMENDPLLPLE